MSLWVPELIFCSECNKSISETLMHIELIGSTLWTFNWWGHMEQHNLRITVVIEIFKLMILNLSVLVPVYHRLHTQATKLLPFTLPSFLSLLFQLPMSLSSIKTSALVGTKSLITLVLRLPASYPECLWFSLDLQNIVGHCRTPEPLGVQASFIKTLFWDKLWVGKAWYKYILWI